MEQSDFANLMLRIANKNKTHPSCGGAFLRFANSLAAAG
jgi:hypothetical protein